MSTPYTIEQRTIGWLTPETVYVAYMPREDFLKILDETVVEVCRDEGADYDRLHAMVDQTAATMERFAMNAWFDPTRGCGCLVGETLIAGQTTEFLDEQDFDATISARKKLSQFWGDDTPNDTTNVEKLLALNYSEDEAEWLFQLGANIDTNIEVKLMNEIDDLDGEGEYKDEDGEYHRIKSVIFV